MGGSTKPATRAVVRDRRAQEDLRERELWRTHPTPWRVLMGDEGDEIWEDLLANQERIQRIEQFGVSERDAELLEYTIETAQAFGERLVLEARKRRGEKR